MPPSERGQHPFERSWVDGLTCWPASLASHDVHCVNASCDLLDMAYRLRHVVEVRSGGVADDLSLPVREGVA